MRALERALVLSLGISACYTPLDMTRDDLVIAEDTEGFAVGSVLLRVVPSGEDSFLSHLQVRADSLEYTIKVLEYRDTRMMFDEPLHSARQYALSLTPGEEKPFVARLRAGRYDFHELIPRGYEECATAVSGAFTVTNRRVTYVGRLVISLPERLNLSNGLSFALEETVEDDQSRAVESMRSAYPWLPDGELRDLAH